MNSPPTDPAPEAPATERRARQRRRAEVEIAYRKVDTLVTSSTRNISEGGAFISAHTPLPLGTKLEVLLPRKDAPAIRVEATVVRVVWGGRQGGKPVAPGMAVAFSFPQPSEKEALVAFLER